jgi:hypothetical protein
MTIASVSVAYDPHAWVEFGVAVLGAAAVLMGLIFVAVSINLERVLAVRGLPGRAGESLIMFLGILLGSAFLLAPGQSREALGIELLVTGAVFVGSLLVVAVPGIQTMMHQPRSWRITRVATAMAASVPVVIAGASLLGEWGGGLYWFLAAVVLAFATGIGNAWVILVEVVRDERHRPAARRKRR